MWFGKKFARKLLKSLGLKRKLASFLSVVLAVAASVPEGADIAPYVMYIASFFGITGLVHAGAAGTVGKYKNATIASILSVLIGFAAQYPLLAPYLPLLYTLAAVFGGAALASDKTK